ncbi:hypothetical protein, partial [Phascolarctobacterium sp.]
KEKRPGKGLSWKSGAIDGLFRRGLILSRYQPLIGATQTAGFAGGNDLNKACVFSRYNRQ